MTEYGSTIRVSKNFKELLEKIINAERERGILRCSSSDASEILYRRILEAGGLKE